MTWPAAGARTASEYALLDAETYLSNEALLNEFCDAVDSKQKAE